MNENNPYVNADVTEAAAPAAPQTPYAPPAPARFSVLATAKDKAYAILFLIFSILWIDFGLFASFDLGHSITFGGLAVLTCLYALTQNRPSITGVYYAVCAFAIAATYTLYVTPGAKTLLFFWSVILLAMSLLDNTRQCSKGWKAICDIAVLVIVTPFRRLAVMFRSLFAKSGDGEKHKAGTGVLIGLACAVPILLIIIPILVDADAAFESLMGAIADNLTRFLFAIIIGAGLFILMFSAVFAAVKRIIRICPVVDTPPAKKQRKGIVPAAVISFLSAISVVYLVYLVSQAAYFFNAFSGLLPKDYTVAEYARRGFGEMAFICVINVVIIALCAILCRKDEKRTLPGAVRGLCIFMCLFTLIIVATVVSKLIMYMSRFGLTENRIYPTLFCIAAAVVIICVAIRFVCRRFPYFRVAAITLAAISVFVAVADIDTCIVRYNTEAYNSGALRELDVKYLGELGETAVPYLYELLDDNEYKLDAAKQLVRIAYDLGDVTDAKTGDYVGYWYDDLDGRRVKFKSYRESFDFREYNVITTRAYDIFEDQETWTKINRALAVKKAGNVI